MSNDLIVKHNKIIEGKYNMTTTEIKIIAKRVRKKPITTIGFNFFLIKPILQKKKRKIKKISLKIDCI